jgi:hypothetical protein
MNWEMFYLICFGIGLTLSVLSYVGGFHHSFHFGGHGSAHSFHLHMGGHRANGVSPVNGFTLTAFLCWFGGAGYLLVHYGGFVMPVVLLLATASGLCGAALIFWFLAKVLMPHDHPLTAEETEMLGVLGRVSGAIRENGTGEILFSQNGARRSSPARSESGKPIARDVEVVVMRYERGIAFVRPWEEISGGESVVTGDHHTSHANE